MGDRDTGHCPLLFMMSSRSSSSNSTEEGTPKRSKKMQEQEGHLSNQVVSQHAKITLTWEMWMRVQNKKPQIMFRQRLLCREKTRRDISVKHQSGNHGLPNSSLLLEINILRCTHTFMTVLHQFNVAWKFLNPRQGLRNQAGRKGYQY